MFTVPSYRQISSGLKYKIKVIDLHLNTKDKMTNPVVCTTSNNFGAALDVIETYRDKYPNREQYPIFVEIVTLVQYQEVRLEEFWIDN